MPRRKEVISTVIAGHRGNWSILICIPGHAYRIGERFKTWREAERVLSRIENAIYESDAIHERLIQAVQSIIEELNDVILVVETHA